MKKESGKKFSARELAELCEDFEIIQRSGLSSADGLRIIAEQTSDERTAEIFAGAVVLLDDGAALSTVLEQTGKFPEFFIAMLEIGEKTGTLESIYASLNEHYANMDTFSRSVKSAVGYPLSMTVLLVAVVGFIIFKIVPVFDSVYRQLGAERGRTLDTAVAISLVLCAFAGVAAAALAALALLIRASEISPTFSEKFMRAVRRVGFAARLQNSAACAVFSSAMSLVLSSGTDVDEGLELCLKAVENTEYRDKIENCRKFLREGAPFDVAISQAELFDGAYGKMLSLGIRSGAGDAAMKKVSENLNSGINEKLESAIAGAEPVAISLMAVVVGIIMLAVMLPLLGMMSSMG